MFCRRRRLNVLFAAILVATMTLNLLFIIDLAANHPHHFMRTGTPILDSTAPSAIYAHVPAHDSMSTKAVMKPSSIRVHVLSSKELVTVAVEEKEVYTSASNQKARGLHVVVLHQITGALMAARVFDTYLPGSDESMVVFINSISDQRILCFAVLDEGTFSLKDNARNSLKAMGSKLIASLSWRDMWAFVVMKGGEVIGEDVGKSVSLNAWGLPVNLKMSVLVTNTVMECDWPDTPEHRKRHQFCSHYEGYGAVCNCATPLQLEIRSPRLPADRASFSIPVAVMASNRPQYLFRMLRSLLASHGSNASLVTVFIDGFFQEPVDVASLFGIHSIQHEPLSEKNGRISQHYKRSLSKTFELHPNAPYILVVEEDLDVSLDFFSYFSQTLHLLEKDPTIYCISAWNDQGYEHSCSDPSLLYRVETMPGLGWVLKRDLFKNELEPIWPGPEKLWDWDMWMRTDGIRRSRECIIPDISRTYHFGSSGLNMNPYFQDTYFSKHALNTVPDVMLHDVDSLQSEPYEVVIHELLRKAVPLDHTKHPCNSDFFPNIKKKLYVIYIMMKDARDFDHWIKLASCFKLWDLDARGFHKGLWRFWLKGNQILVIGHPHSPYSSKYKPVELEPLHLATPKTD